MDENQTIIKFRRELSSFYGYDENLKYSGRHKASPRPRRTEAFLEPRDFLQFAIEEAWTLEQEKSRTNWATTAANAVTAISSRWSGVAIKVVARPDVEHSAKPRPFGATIQFQLQNPQPIDPTKFVRTLCQ